MVRDEVSPGRSLIAALGMLGTGLGVVYLAATEAVHPPAFVYAIAAAIGVAGIGLTRGPIVAKVLARAIAWLGLVPLGAYSLVSVLMGRTPELEALGMAGALGAALVAARPALHTARARAEFAPAAYRRLFLAGAVGTTSAALLAGTIAVGELTGSAGSLRDAALFGVFALALAGSALGVLRMRAWGVLLGGLTAAALLVGAAVVPGGSSTSLLLTALPMLLGFVGPVLLARLGLGRGESGPRVAAAPARIASSPEEEAAAELDAELDAEPAARKLELRA